VHQQHIGEALRAVGEGHVKVRCRGGWQAGQAGVSVGGAGQEGRAGRQGNSRETAGASLTPIPTLTLTVALTLTHP